MLELEVVPEISLGCEQWEFILGMHFSQAVAIIQSQVGIIKAAQVLYCDINPLEGDLVINLPLEGIRLIFDPSAQLLKIIEVYDLKLVKLKYCGILFNSPEIIPSLEQIDHSFGATRPGVFDAEKGTFVLNFRGLSFHFPSESKYQPDYAHGLGSLQFPNGSSPRVSKMCVYTGNNLLDTTAPPLPISCYFNHLYLESLDVLREGTHTTGLRMKLCVENASQISSQLKKQSQVCEIHFGNTCQDVMSALGAPSRIFYKSEDKMKIHSSNARKRALSHRSDFFYNYFTLGMDFLFDAKSHQVKKFVLHTNFPGHYNFNMYHRCEFNLYISEKTSVNKGQLIDLPSNPLVITSISKWLEISDHLKVSKTPVVLNRASSTNTTNPFGSTLCYGCQDIIFEVMQNGHIASVTLYSTKYVDSDV